MSGTDRLVMPWHRRARRPRPPTGRLARAVLATVVALATVLTVAGPADSARRPAPEPDAGVVVQWDRIAVRTLAENTVPPPLGALTLGIVQLAVYDAVVAVEGGADPYLPQPRARARARASAEVAAATAAHRMLVSLFPSSTAALDAEYASTVAGLPGGAARVHGVRAGEAAAATMLAARRDDGRSATVPLVVELAPGVWRPTPDAFAQMAMSQLGFVRPLVLASPTAVPLPGPDALTSDAYAAEYAEVKAYGAKDGSSRSAAQTATALFWNANVVQQYHLALGAEVLEDDMGILDGARAFALLGAATGDAAIACWRAKYDHAYWRPVTAIRLGDTDGNAATVADPAWTPLAMTPPYPDYPSGHGCVTGAASEVFGHLFGASSIDLDVPFPPDATVATRHFATTAQLDAETMDARILLGLHFRRAMRDANALGHAVGAQTVARLGATG